MLLIDCPYCGPRPEIEFRWRTESGIERPPAGTGGRTLGEYLYFRRNTKGRESELWWHASGCRQWLSVLRNTATHEIFAVRPLEAPTNTEAGAGVAIEVDDIAAAIP